MCDRDYMALALELAALKAAGMWLQSHGGSSDCKRQPNHPEPGYHERYGDLMQAERAEKLYGIAGRSGDV
ncbi:MAG: hypothetical protein ACLU48_02035 [Clostridiaceae bacterium]